jgi:hypothetical protein
MQFLNGGYIDLTRYVRYSYIYVNVHLFHTSQGHAQVQPTSFYDGASSTYYVHWSAAFGFITSH